MADDKIKKLVALLEKMPKTDRGYSWELRNARGHEEIRAYGENASTFKFILDHTDELIAALSEAEKRDKVDREKILGECVKIIYKASADICALEKVNRSYVSRMLHIASMEVRALQSEER